MCAAYSFAFPYALAAFATSTVFRAVGGGWERSGEGGG